MCKRMVGDFCIVVRSAKVDGFEICGRDCSHMTNFVECTETYFIKEAMLKYQRQELPSLQPFRAYMWPYAEASLPLLSLPKQHG